jgi:hypothetical protein
MGPGKQTLTAALGTPAANSDARGPGKRTLTEDLPPQGKPPGSSVPEAQRSSGNDSAPDATGTSMPPASGSGSAPQGGETPADTEAQEKALASVDPATAFQVATSGTPSPLPYQHQLTSELGVNLEELFSVRGFLIKNLTDAQKECASD